MSSNVFTPIEGSELRAKLRSKGLPGGGEQICCGGRKKFSRDYETQLRRLKYTGSFAVMENGIVVAFVTI